MHELSIVNRAGRMAMLWAFSTAAIVVAQESPTPTPSLPAEESATPLSSPAQTPSPSPVRNVRISFVPPPMEGTISLGIYDQDGKLVRVLHRETPLSAFTVGPDALITWWDGKADDGQDLSNGKYHARGYLVAVTKAQEMGATASAPAMPDGATATVKQRLVPNPLQNDKSPIAEIGIGFDAAGSYLKTGDGLPLLTVSNTPNLLRAALVKKRGNTVEIWQEDGTGVHQFRISNLDQMMAFDCGEVELK